MTGSWWIVNWPEIGLVPVVIAAILGLMAAVRALAGRVGLGPELQRKIVHVAVGVSSRLFPLLFSSPLPVLLLIAAAIAVMLALRTRAASGGIGSVLHSVTRPSYGEIYLALSVAFLFLRSQAQPILYVLPLLVVTLSDTASALVGTAYGRLRFAVPDGSKSIEGVVAFFTVTWICAMIALLLMSDAGRLNVLLLAFLIAAFCALIEADSWRGLDNLFVPIGAHLLLERHLHADPASLLILAAAYAAAIVLANRYAEAAGLSRQAMRAYAVMLLLIVTVTHPVNAILPAIAIVTHAVLRRTRPGPSRTPSLDFIAAGSGAALIWLLTGEAIGLTAINLFSIHFAGVALIFTVLATRRADAPLWRWALPVAAAAALAAVTVTVVTAGPATQRWHGAILPPLLASLALCMAVAWARPAWFLSWRSPKAFAVAAVVPMLVLVQGVVR